MSSDIKLNAPSLLVIRMTAIRFAERSELVLGSDAACRAQYLQIQQTQ